MKELFFYRVFIFSLLFMSLSTPAIAKKMSILVYPFENKGNNEYSWISAGMTETVINDLMGLRDVIVISNEDRIKIMEETKFILSGLVAEQMILKVGKLTGVNVIFAGSYLVSDNKIKVIARLINVETGEVESSAKFDGTLEKIFELQDKVVLRLLSDAGRMSIQYVSRVRVAEAEKKKIVEKPRQKTTAYELYAKGLELKDTNPKEALAYYEKALDIDEDYVSALIQAGFTAGYTLTMFDEAMDYLTRADEILESKNTANNIDYAMLLRNIGVVYKSKGDLDRALRYYLDAQEILQGLGLQNTPNYSTLIMNIGSVYEIKGYHDRALRYYTNSKQIQEGLGLRITANYATLIMNIGRVYNSKDDIDHSLRYYRESQRIFDMLGMQNTPGYADLMNNIGLVYDSQGDLDRALRYCMDSQQIFDRLGLQSTSGYAALLFKIGQLYEKRGETDMAGRYYRKSYDSHVRAGVMGSDSDAAFSNAQRLGY